MGKLGCTAKMCVNNVDELCTANVIHVKGKKAERKNETFCGTFGKSSVFNAIYNLPNFNLPGAIRQLVNGDEIEISPRIKCDAVNCIYNQNEECTADNLQIYARGSNLDKAECETFNKR